MIGRKLTLIWLFAGGFVYGQSPRYYGEGIAVVGGYITQVPWEADPIHQLINPVECEAVCSGGYWFVEGPNSIGLRYFWPQRGTFNLSLRHTAAGDANNDHQVQFDDFIILANYFGQNNAKWERGDFDYDRLVDYRDFVLLANNFGAMSGSTAVIVPEPMTSLLLLVGAAVGSSMRRRFANKADCARR